MKLQNFGIYFLTFLVLSCSKKEQSSSYENSVISPTESRNETVQNSERSLTKEELFDSLPKEWTMLTSKNGKQIIYIPCDYQNQKILLENQNGILKLTHEIAQDGYYFLVENIEKRDEKYIFTLKEEHSEKETKKIIYTLEPKENHQAIWNVYDDEGKLTNITTTDSRFESEYKTEEEPPCLE